MLKALTYFGLLALGLLAIWLLSSDVVIERPTTIQEEIQDGTEPG